MYLGKRGLHPVIGGVLLLIFAVMSVVSFQGWFASYSTQIFNHVEIQRDIGSFVRVEGVAGDSLYLKSDSDTTLNNLKIVNNSGSIMCEIGDSSESTAKGVTKLLFDFEKNNLNSTHVKDLSGYDNDGVLNGGVNCSVGGVSGRGCEFDGIDDWINVSEKDSFNISKEITVGSWVRWSGNMDSNYQRIVCASNEYFCYWIINKNYTSGEHHMAVRLTGTSRREPTKWLQIKFNITKNIEDIWTHLVFTYNGNYTYAYIDGEKTEIAYYGNETAYHDYDYYYGDLDVSYDGDFLIGNRYKYDRPFNGTIDEIVIYSKALSDSEVQSLYESQKAKFYDQILPDGVKEINVSFCNLTAGEKYSFVGLNDDEVFEESFIKK